MWKIYSFARTVWIDGCACLLKFEYCWFEFSLALVREYAWMSSRVSDCYHVKWYICIYVQMIDDWRNWLSCRVQCTVCLFKSRKLQRLSVNHPQTMVAIFSAWLSLAYLMSDSSFMNPFLVCSLSIHKAVQFLFRKPSVTHSVVWGISLCTAHASRAQFFTTGLRLRWQSVAQFLDIQFKLVDCQVLQECVDLASLAASL